MHNMIQKLLAYFRLSQKAVCEQSAGKGLYNCYHDYPDDEYGQPIHMYDLKCKHCGKLFRI